MGAQDIIQTLRSALSLNALSFNEEGVCTVFIPGELEIQFECDTESGQLIALGLLGNLGDDVDGQRARTLLAANFLFSGTRGESLSLEPDTRKVFLCAAWAAAGNSPASLVEWLENFVDTARYWRNRLEAREIASSAPPLWAQGLMRG
jgi:hypothetical protein